MFRNYFLISYQGIFFSGNCRVMSETVRELVEVKMQWWRSLMLGSLVRRDDIYDKVTDCNQENYLEILRPLTNF